MEQGAYAILRQAKGGWRVSHSFHSLGFYVTRLTALQGTPASLDLLQSGKVMKLIACLCSLAQLLALTIIMPLTLAAVKPCC